jgi:hypothetical protein
VRDIGTAPAIALKFVNDADRIAGSAENRFRFRFGPAAVAAAGMLQSADATQRRARREFRDGFLSRAVKARRSRASVEKNVFGLREPPGCRLTVAFAGF